MDVDMEKATHSPAPAANEKQTVSRPQTSRTRAASLPEVDLYIHLIVLLYLIDRNSLKSVNMRFRRPRKPPVAPSRLSTVPSVS